VEVDDVLSTPASDASARVAARRSQTFAGKASHSRDTFPASVFAMAETKTATPWGPAKVVDELTVRQQAGERRFASVMQLLETAAGERLVRVAYTTDGSTRRGPVTLRARDLERVRAQLEKHPDLADAIGL
jgi:hypothetical protein